MAFGDIMSGLVLATQESDQILSDRSDSSSPNSSDDEGGSGLIGSLFGFMGFGRKKRARKTKHPKISTKEQNNVYDYKREYIRESS